MTILTLAHHTKASIHTSYRQTRAVQWFLYANRRGTVTIMLFVALTLGAGLYLGALFQTFQSGFALRKDTVVRERTQDAVAKLELKVQERQASLVSEHEQILASMEKITSITYLTPERVAVSTVRSSQ